jgi:hypothetical protein
MVLAAFCALMLLLGFIAHRVAKAIERWDQHHRDQWEDEWT